MYLSKYSEKFGIMSAHIETMLISLEISLGVVGIKDKCKTLFQSDYTILKFIKRKHIL